MKKPRCGLPDINSDSYRAKYGYNFSSSSVYNIILFSFAKRDCRSCGSDFLFVLETFLDTSCSNRPLGSGQQTHVLVYWDFQFGHGESCFLSFESCHHHFRNLILFLSEDGHWAAKRNRNRDIGCDIKLRGLHEINAILSKVSAGTTPIWHGGETPFFLLLLYYPKYFFSSFVLREEERKTYPLLSKATASIFYNGRSILAAPFVNSFQGLL